MHGWHCFCYICFFNKVFLQKHLKIKDMKSLTKDGQQVLKEIADQYDLQLQVLK